MMIRHTKFKITFMCLLPFLMFACATNSSNHDKRQAITEMETSVLSELFNSKPSVKEMLRSASGYAVFDSANVNLILASFGGGVGVAQNNNSGKRVFMKMAEVGVGFGAGVKDFRLVFIFHSPEAYQRFVTEGWAFGAQADAAAKAGDKGAATGGETTVDNITIYQLTKSGLALQATVKGTKFWVDEALNN